MSVQLLIEHHLEFLSLKKAAQARLSLHSSKCHTVGNHIPVQIRGSVAEQAYLNHRLS